MLLKHYEQNLYTPGYMAMGFAAYLLFMKCEPVEDGKYYGEINGLVYLVQDDQAGYYHKLWKNSNLNEVVKKGLSNEALWGTDLTSLGGFAFAVEFYLNSIMCRGVLETLKEFEINRHTVESYEA